MLIGKIETVVDELTLDQCLGVFKLYDFAYYKYISHNRWFFGADAKNYAKYLLEQNNKHDGDIGDHGDTLHTDILHGGDNAQR